MFSRLLRMQLMGPLQMRGLIMFLPQFVRVFWRLMHDARVSTLAKAVPFLGVLALHFAAAAGTRLHPHHRRTRLDSGRLHLPQDLHLAVPARRGARARQQRRARRLARGSLYRCDRGSSCSASPRSSSSSLIVLGLADELLVDLLWFGVLGYRSVFLTQLGAQITIFAARVVRRLRRRYALAASSRWA